MAYRSYLAICLCAGWLVTTASVASADEPPSAKHTEFFEKSIRPLLATHCFECHGPKKQRAGLRLDTRAAMMTGGDTGAAIVPGQPEKSLLIKAVHYRGEPKMPPDAPLTAEQIAALTLWIKDGAVWPQTTAEVRPVGKEPGFRITPKDREFWSFRPIVAPALPAVRGKSWPQTSIDHFILAKLEATGLQPVEAADRRTLIRRATFDLIGLPPTPAEVDAFVNDKAPDAFAKVVDRLLSSPHYGERWARHWLDIARYGEDQAHTFQARKYPQGFRYRDWLIQAFNADLPYDRFILEQLAADLLPEANRLDNLPALGFFACGPVYYGDPKRLDQIDDRIDTLTRGLLGLTVACARCHDHKFDPIATKDYYSLAGVIASTDYVEVSLEPGNEGKVIVPVKAKDNKKPAPKAIPFIHTLREAPNPGNLRVHVRGNPKTLGEEAPRRFMPILMSDEPPPFTRGSGRLELARAIADKDNPLTARVFVNRIWQHHFGKGIVRTTSNFGALGERPTHPELLDHLATLFVKNGWSIKKLHREIMLSATYQLSSRAHAQNADADPDNKLLAHASRRRLEVEAWRDAMLAVSRKLDSIVGGPSLNLAAPDNRRRTLYGMVSRHELNSLLRLFDFPDPNITSGGRTVTTVPLQQLFVLNSEFMVQNAKALAARLATTGPEDDARIRAAFLLLYGRPATEREVQLGVGFLSAGSAPQGGLSRWEQYAQVLLATNEFLYVD
ncbi:MAG TPA: PSD1 and planctomycete cytochrome C domain-containing protein [Gemmataceae bacterium]|nr:PSD1 and planctomycete cytochrome C domain-containing protein [Gemmataceae bacterium]